MALRPCRSCGRVISLVSRAILVITPLIVAPPSWAQGTQVDQDALVRELQLSISDPPAVTMVWWMPEEYWAATFALDPSISEADVEDVVKTLAPYTLILAVDATVGPFGGFTFVPEAELRASVRLVDVGGNEYRPLPDGDIDPDAKSFAVFMQPIVAGPLGPLGENLNFFFFPAENPDGARLAEATKEGQLVIMVGEREFRWRLPLGSLLPAKICPVDGERLNGAWKYCPWHGVELLVAADTVPPGV